ncbi:hypothetical protein DH2020_029317 [Rehmannia glutinosa]|uniref:BHLH domain-containing protein n=1 Tax=Rehmannia glutinosa TaxID=99300 RepID=A0ABR0VSI5_REHGL
MEHIGAISEGEWNSLNGMCSDEAEFMAQLLGNCSLPNEVPSDSNFPVSATFWPAHDSNAAVDESSMYSSDETNVSMYSLSQGSSYSGGTGIFFPFSSGHESYHYPSATHQFLVTNNNLMTMDLCMMESKENNSLNQDVSNDSLESNENMSEGVLQGKNLQLGMELAIPMPELPKEEKITSPSESRKRSRIPGEVQRNKRSMKPKKCPKPDDNEENNNNNNNMGLHRQSSSGCCSEDDSNASHELNGKRRERINERLRILQSLVPNGTKVDISTMLEEAVQYVKFLQLQIKLLSSDDMWMYAPLAYNGMDIGLDLKISTPKPQS